MDADLDKLTRTWDKLLPGIPPISNRLRDFLRDRWVRFHSLPESKRYPDTADEWDELLLRHNTVMSELLGSSSPPALVYVLTASWSDDPSPQKRSSDLRSAYPDAAYWTSVAPDEYADTWTHLYAGTTEWAPGVLNRLLRLVATYQTAGVIIAPADLRWLYHPYDGGADVIAETPANRDALRDKHRSWLSAQPSGM